MQTKRHIEQIGHYSIAIGDVETVDLVDGEGGDLWIRANVEIIADGPTGEERRRIEGGCWRDTNADEQEWSASAEGGRAIAALLDINAECGSPDSKENDIACIMPEEAAVLGSLICDAIREAHRNEND